MLKIYAQAFMTATRTDKVEMREHPKTNKTTRRRWFQRGKTVQINPLDL
ncbi:hypothetical protein [Sulfitobacter sp. M368]|nr:hypothetical protein [Sulfitobacter sp. M368]UWR15806.1 hypothetical protein K3754_02565 [Sulfitobacter sp. M368]